MPVDRTLLVVAARVRTFHEPVQPQHSSIQADAVICVNGRIVAVGPSDRLRARGQEVIELPGTTLTPGLTDSHIHITEWALARRTVDLAAARSPDEAAAAVALHGRVDAAGWIRGRGWNPQRWSGEEPLAAQLDRVAPDVPVVLQSHDMHALWVNSAALRRAGIDAGTADPEGGRIVRDRAGAPTGLLLENAGRLVAACVPAPTFGETLDAVLDAQAELHRLGITGIHSLPGILIPEPDPLSILEALRAADRLRLRVLQHLPLHFLEDAKHLGLRSGFGGEWVRIGGIKSFLDGTLGSRTAWMRAPYDGATDCGIRVLPAEDFRDAVRGAAASGLATTVHAIGDAAVALAIDTLTDPAVRVGALPHRIEHVQCFPEDSEGGGETLASRAAERLALLARNGIVGSMQPAHLISDWRAADRHWGSDRGRRTYAFRTLLDAGATLAFGSDAPVEPVDPRLGMLAAVRRTDLDGLPDGGWNPEQRITMQEVFRGYTAGPAIAAARRGMEGQMTPGAVADLVAWSDDPLDPGVDPLKITCAATFVGGEPVHGQPMSGVS